LPEEDDIVLSEQQLQLFYDKYFRYFKTLNPAWQKVFISRCIKFISQKIIIGAEGFKPNNKVKAIISASAVQLTLGLETWSLNYFDTIIIHPKDFDNKASGLKFKGETNLAGYIRLSWQSLISGYRMGNDNVNLGIHEFTHALRFNPIIGFEQDYFIEHYFNGWLASANQAYNDIRHNRETIFRKYGGANINEFLSVCIEHFFEAPHQIKEKYPLLYYSTAILLNQYTENGLTELNIRQKLFEEKNKLLNVKQEYDINTSWTKTSSFKIMVVITFPLIYTMGVTGFTSGVSMTLLFLLLAFYLRFDYHYITTHLKNNRFFLQKGLFLFKNRRKLEISLSQLVSMRLYGNGSGDSECELIYYDINNHSFYMEEIAVGKTFSNEFLSEVVANKIAIFKS